MLAPIWHMLAYFCHKLAKVCVCCSMLALCWLYVGSMLAHVGSMLAYVGPMLTHVGPMLAYVGAMLAHAGPILPPKPLRGALCNTPQGLQSQALFGIYIHIRSGGYHKGRRHYRRPFFNIFGQCVQNAKSVCHNLVQTCSGSKRPNSMPNSMCRGLPHDKD